MTTNTTSTKTKDKVAKKEGKSSPTSLQMYQAAHKLKSTVRSSAKNLNEAFSAAKDELSVKSKKRESSVRPRITPTPGPSIGFLDSPRPTHNNYNEYN